MNTMPDVFLITRFCDEFQGDRDIKTFLPLSTVVRHKESSNLSHKTFEV